MIIEETACPAFSSRLPTPRNRLPILACKSWFAFSQRVLCKKGKPRLVADGIQSIRVIASTEEKCALVALKSDRLVPPCARRQRVVWLTLCLPLRERRDGCGCPGVMGSRRVAWYLIMAFFMFLSCFSAFI